MGLRYTRRVGGAIGGENYHAMAAALRGIIEEELAIAGEEGEKLGKQIISTSGTNNEWSGDFHDRNGNVRSGSGTGRVDTGTMLNALTFRLVRGNSVGLDVGWPGVWEAYFTAQDQGFSAPGYRHARQWVEGMGVIATLQVFMRARVDAALDEVERRVIRGL